jgi:hypothetical protein
MPERIEGVDDRCLLVADHSHFREIDGSRRQIFRDIADDLVRPDRSLPPITRSAAATTSSDADEFAVGMITCECPRAQTPAVRPSDERLASALFRHCRM